MSQSADLAVYGQGEIQQRPMLKRRNVRVNPRVWRSLNIAALVKLISTLLGGCNLDHGTDFATSIDGMPINMRSHGHGQGYTDLSFMIPESISTINYRKGSYSASRGDFSTAGNVPFQLADNLKHHRVELSIGEDNYRRLLYWDLLTSQQVSSLQRQNGKDYDGPWDDINEDVNKRMPYCAMLVKLLMVTYQ
ncbi:hypothetical protein P4S63_23805 [Pseudoalteromonas sp. B193]